MTQKLGALTYLVRDYDEAVGWFTQVLGFVLTADTDLGGGKRFVEAPRHEAYGTVAVFEDLYGQRWDLIQHT